MVFSRKSELAALDVLYRVFHGTITA